MPRGDNAGRPTHEPTDATRAKVEALAGYGAPQPYIAKEIGVDEKTLRKHYRDELDFAADRANLAVQRSLHRKAIGHTVTVKKLVKKANGETEVREVEEYYPADTAAAIWWDKTRNKQSETINQNVTGTVETVTRRIIDPNEGD